MYVVAEVFEKKINAEAKLSFATHAMQQNIAKQNKERFFFEKFHTFVSKNILEQPLKSF